MRAEIEHRDNGVTMTDRAAPPRLLLDLGLLYAAAIWGATFFIVKDALAGVHPVPMVGYRFVICAACLVPWVLRAKNRRRHLREAAILSALLIVLYVSQTLGLETTSASNSGFITGLFVLFVPLLMFAFFRQRPSPLHELAVALAVCGLWVLTGGLRAINRGDALTLIAAFCYAAHLLTLDRAVKRNADPLLLTFHQFWMTGLACTALAVAARLPLGVRDGRTAGVIVFLALFPTLSAFLVQTIAQRHTPPLKVALIFSTEPVFAALFAWTIGGETFRPASAWGGALIVCGMVLAELARAPAERASADAAGARTSTGARGDARENAPGPAGSDP